MAGNSTQQSNNTSTGLTIASQPSVLGKPGIITGTMKVGERIVLNEEEFKIALDRTLKSTRESLQYAPPEEQDMHWENLYEKLLAIFRSMNP